MSFCKEKHDDIIKLEDIIIITIERDLYANFIGRR